MTREQKLALKRFEKALLAATEWVELNPNLTCCLLTD
jgi:hypothetical protein